MKKIVLSVIVTMITVIVQAAAGGNVKLGDWYEAHLDDEATTCMRWDDFYMGANVAIPVTGIASPIPASDVVVTAGTYSEFGTPYVLTEGEMWNRYGAPVLREKNLGNVEFDCYDNVWQNWDAEEDGAYGYELSADVWPNWSQVSGRQWILIPTGVPRLGTHTFSVKINGVKHDNYVVSFVMAEDQEPVPYNVTLSVAGGHELRGKVSGGGAFYIAGKKASLKATANKGYVFAGWEGPLDDTVDPRNPSISYVVEPADVEFVAKFISLAADVADISFTMPKECQNGVAIANVSVDVSRCTSLPMVKVAGLPAGLKFTAKPIYRKGSKTEIEVPANTIYGTPTKSGVYTIVATVTTVGKKTATYSQTVIVRKSGEKVVVAECDATGGKVTGCGVYAAGKKVTLKATPNKGYVFAGWYEDEAFTTPCDSTVVDYRTASYSYTMGNEDKTFYARIVPAAADSILNLTVGGENVPTTFTISEYAQLSLDVDSLSLPKISVKGLPAGMKFTAKPIYKKGSKTEIEVPANTIYGAPTKPGLAKVQVPLSNQSIKKAIVKEFSIEVPNLTGANSYFVDDLDNDGVGKKRVLSVGITNIDDFLPNLKLKSNIAKLAVSGLPAGLKYDAKTGKITGVATKAGTYTVTLTVTEGKDKYVSTVTVVVNPLPSWIVGKFYGDYYNGHDSWPMQWELSVSQTGKIELKNVECDGETMKLSVSGLQLYTCYEDNVSWYGKGVDCTWDEYCFDVISTSKLDVEGHFSMCGNFRYSDGFVQDFYPAGNGTVGMPMEFIGAFCGYIEGCDEEGNDIDVEMELYQDTYASQQEQIVLPVFKTGENEFVLDDTVRFNYRDWTENVPVLIQMKFDAKGNVKMSWMGDGKFKMFPAHLTPFGVAKDGAILANLYIMGGLGTGEWYGFGMNMVLRIPCNKDNIADIDDIEYEITSAYIDKE